MKHYSSNLLLILLFATYLPQILYANRKPEHIDKDSCFLLNNEFTHAWLNQNIKLRDSLILNSKIFDVLGIANITKQQASQITTSDAEQLIANLNNWQKCYFESIFIVFVDSVVMQSGSNEIENYLIHKNRETEKILSHIDMKLLTNEIYLRVLRYYFHLGDLFLDKSMPHDALTAFEIGATLAAQRKDIFQIPYLFNLERIASTQTDLTLYEKAKETYNKLLDISYNDPDIDSELKSTIVVNASSLFLKMGLYSDALRIVERSNLKDNEYLLQLNKATCLEKLGYSDKAADILKDLLKLKPDDPTRQLILINIGNNLLSRREYLEAEKYTKDAINLLQKNIAIDSSIEYISNLAIAYFNLGEIYLHTESLSEAASWYSKALQTRKIYTTDSADFNILQDLDRLSLISLRQGKFTDCFDKTNFVFSNLLEKYRKYYSILNYEEGQHLLQKWNSLLGRSISTMLELRNYHPINIEDIFEYDINLRGSLTNQARLIKEEINVRNKLNQDSTYILYENLRSKLIAAQEVDILDKIKSIENRIISKLNFIQNQPIKIEELKHLIKPNEVLLHFIRCEYSQPYYAKSDTIYYIAMVDKKGLQGIYPMCHERDIKLIINQFRRGEISTDSLGSFILENLPMKISNFAVCPTGAFYQFPFFAMSNNKKLLLESGNIRILHDYVYDLSPSRQINTEKILLLGGFKYGSGLNQTWAYLPNSKTEINEIRKILGTSEVDQKVELKEEITKSSFYELLMQSSYKIIHIATHGYYIPQDSAKYNSSMPFKFSINNSPFLRSGLIVSDANESWIQYNNGDEGNIEGIISSRDMIDFSLSNTKLVYLSSCFSGEGELNRDGIWGVPSALRVAGAKNFILSNWAVPDKTALDFATNFYSQYSENNDISKSFQRTILNLYTQSDPRYWGTFMLISTPKYYNSGLNITEPIYFILLGFIILFLLKYVLLAHSKKKENQPGFQE